MCCESQNKQILAHMKSGGSVTSLEAVSMFNCMQLASRIFELIADGQPIKKEWVRLKNWKNVVRYSYDFTV